MKKSLLFLVLAVMLTVSCGGTKRAYEVYKDTDVTNITPKGIKIRAPKIRPTTQAMDAIDAGAEQLFADAKCGGYDTNGLSIDQIEVVYMPSELSASGFPVYRFPITGAFQGTEFDKGGYLLVAGEFIINPGPTHLNAVAVAESNVNLLYLKGAVKNELQHWFLYKKDRGKYAATSGYHVHPIMSECSDSSDRPKVPTAADEAICGTKF